MDLGESTCRLSPLRLEELNGWYPARRGKRGPRRDGCAGREDCGAGRGGPRGLPPGARFHLVLPVRERGRQCEAGRETQPRCWNDRRLWGDVGYSEQNTWCLAVKVGKYTSSVEGMQWSFASQDGGRD